MTASPFAPENHPDMPPIGGVHLATGACGVRYKDRKDVLLMRFAKDTAVAGVFTQSLTAAACIDACRQALENGVARGLVVNSGNANAFTGAAGDESVKNIQQECAKLFNCSESDIFTASTGVIGVQLPDEKITTALPILLDSLTPDAWHEAAQAIMTTDTYPKMVTTRTDIGGKEITINGIAKGSGMIAPDMATMLAFVCTDADIPAPILQELLVAANATTFNSITVDSDTSTNDTLLCFATAAAGNPAVKSASDPQLAAFAIALHDVLHELAMLIIKDGEGIQKLVEITVSGAATEKAARLIGMSIANSPLVKTAIAAADANWGRIVAAVGKAGQRADRDKLAITIGGVDVAKNGRAVEYFDEAPVTAHMKGREICITVDVGVGESSCTVWTCDLTERYLAINGSYRS
ncbi:MAG: bifunctional glutamate N-acetyltransferase/amino-acid acetyltransferase ArgJ [Alphaproteobacteria bacterium]